jgi:hypothetical protein
MKAAIFEKTGLENLSESKFWIWNANRLYGIPDDVFRTLIILVELLY